MNRLNIESRFWMLLFCFSVFAVGAKADLDNCGWPITGSEQWECFPPDTVADLKLIVDSYDPVCEWLLREKTEGSLKDEANFIGNCKTGYNKLSASLNHCDLESLSLDYPRPDAERYCGKDICSGLYVFLELGIKPAQNQDLGKGWSRAISAERLTTLVGVSPLCKSVGAYRE